MNVFKGEQRGPTKIDWLDSKHSFSFGGWQDPARMGYSDLRVLNDDRVAPGLGFGTHPHGDMEIISFVLEGQLEHKDSMGNGSVIEAGDVQYMSAGTGVRHSEFNPSEQSPAHFLQVWIIPDKRGYEPKYAQRHFSRNEKLNTWKLALSKEPTEDVLPVRQDTKIYLSVLEEGKELPYSTEANRKGYIHVINGEVSVNGESYGEGDAIELVGGESVTFTGVKEAQLLAFDLRG